MARTCVTGGGVRGVTVVGGDMCVCSADRWWRVRVCDAGRRRGCVRTTICITNETQMILIDDDVEKMIGITDNKTGVTRLANDPSE